MTALEKEVLSPSYQLISSQEAKIKRINGIIGRYREAARTAIKREYPELQTGSSIKADQPLPSDIAALYTYGTN